MPSNDKISPAAAAAITPFDFRLTNRWGQPVLFTRLLQQDLTLELINTSRAELTIEPIAPGKAETVPTAEDSQFHLRFRSGTLWDPKIALEPRSPWKISPAQYPPGHSAELAADRADDVVFYLRYDDSTSALKLASGSGPVKIRLLGIGVDGRAGSHGTRVQLRYQHLQSVDHKRPLSGTSMHYISVLDESPSDEAGLQPILIDWAGPNKFLNDGSATTRTLRITNQSGKTIKLDPTTAKITIELPVGTAQSGWALIADHDKSSVKVEQLTNGWHRTGNASELPIVLAPVAAGSEFRDKASLDFPITLATTCPTGSTFISVTYAGFAHLDHAQLVPVVKTLFVVEPTIKTNAAHTKAVVIDASGNVGIGTTTPTEKLSILSADSILANILAVSALDKTQGVGVSYTGIRKLTHNNSNDLYIDGAAGSTGNILLNASSGGSTGNVGIGTTSALAKLSVLDGRSVANIGGLYRDSEYSGIAFTTHSAAVTTENYSLLGNGKDTFVNRPTNGIITFRENNRDQMTISSGGKVGIGTISPSAKLSVTGEGTGNGRAFAIADINNVEKFTVLDNGNVGIGVNNPTKARLEVSGNSTQNFSSSSYFNNTSTTWEAGILAQKESALIKLPIKTLPKHTYAVSSGAFSGNMR